MITFGHYGVAKDVSGVTTWLVGFGAELKSSSRPFGTIIHHFGPEPSQGSFFQSIQPLASSLSVITLPTDTESLCKLTLQALNTQKPQVFLPQCLPALHFTAHYAASLGLPWVFTMHSDDPDYWALADLVGPTKDSGSWVVVSEFLKDECLAKYPNVDIRVIPYGVPVASRIAKWHPERFRIVYSGRMVEQQKRISLVAQTAVAACLEHPHIEFVLIGDGVDRPKAETIVKSHQLDGRIRFTGRLDSVSLQSQLDDAQAIFLMSDYEGLPVSLIEGMAKGLVPMAKYCKSGVPELIHPNQTGLILDENPNLAGAQIAQLAKDRNAWLAYSNAAYDLAKQRYSTQICMSKWMELIDQLQARATIQYPVAIPKRFPLPAVDPRLARIDHRQPDTWWHRVRNRIRKLQAKVIGAR